MELGVDYSAADIDPQTLRNAGYTFAMRYLWFPGQQHATLNKGWLDRARAAGLKVGPIWETYANRALGGFAAGAADAVAADAEVKAAGAPGAVIYFAVDFDATEGQQAAINSYFDGAASVVGKGRVAGYGGYWVIKRLFDAGRISYGWQAVAWSGGNKDSRISMFQRLGTPVVAGVACDINELYKPAGLIGEDDMSWTEPLPELDDNFNATDKTNPAWVYMLVNWRAIRQMKAELDEIKTKLDGLGTVGGAPLTDAQLDAIAQRVIDFLKKPGN